MTVVVVDTDLSHYFDTIRHHILLEKIGKRVQDDQVMHLVKQVIKVASKNWRTSMRTVFTISWERLCS